MRFEWDERKNRTNVQKHGVDFREAAWVFSDPFALNIPDAEHSNDEERWILLGMSSRDRLLLVVHTDRSFDCIRIISARNATRHERDAYRKRLKR